MRLEIAGPPPIPRHLPGDRTSSWVPVVMGKFLLARREESRVLASRILRDGPPAKPVSPVDQALARARDLAERLDGARRVLAGTAFAQDWDDR